jgi:hypothetical protein
MIGTGEGMAIVVEKSLGLSKEEAVLDAVSRGLIVTIQNAEEGDAEQTHWHKWDTHLYLVDGEFRGLDPTNPELVLEPGDYCVVPKETLHAGRYTKACTIVIGVTSELLDSVTVQEDPANLA